MPYTLRDTTFLAQARARYKRANEADSKQAQRERDDIAFEDGQQWPSDLLNARGAQSAAPKAGAAAMPSTPARPSLVINKVREPVQNTLNQVRQADIGVQLVAAEDFGDLGLTPDDTEITLREGLIRRIQRESHAQDARMWAFKRALIAGRGYYLVMVRYLPGKTWDQEVYVERIYHQEAVLGDPSRQKPDGSDADYWFIGTWVPWERFAADYPEDANGDKNPFCATNDADFMSLTEAYPDWYKQDGDERAVRVTAHWFTERTSKKLAIMSDGRELWADEVPDGETPVETRTVVEKQIKFSRIAGGVLEVERTDWAGPDMPIVQVLGDEILPYDEQKRYEGMVRPARDAQQGENYMISKFVETVGLTPISPLQVDPEAIDGYEAWYAVANTRALPYLPSRTYNDEGRQLKEPHRPAVDPNILPMAQGISLFDQFIRSTTAVPDSTLGNVDPSLRSARAIHALVSNAQTSTSGFLDNLGVAVSYEGKVENNLLYPIYGRKPGRLVRILTGDGESQVMQVGDPSAQAQQRQAAQKLAVLTPDAHFNVIVKVTRNSDNRRAQFLQMFSEILQANPQQMAVAGDLFYKNMDIPEARQLAKRMRTMLAPPVQQLLASEEQGQPYDPVAQAKIAQLTQQVQHAEMALQELDQIANGKKLDYQKAIETEHIKQAAENTRFQMATDKDITLKQMDDAKAIRVAEIAAQAKIGVAQDANALEAMALGAGHAHEQAQDAQAAQQAQQQQQADQQHEKDLADRQVAGQIVTQPDPAQGAAAGAAS